MKQTTAQRHLDAIRAGSVTKTNVIGIRKALSHVDRQRAGWSGHRSNVTVSEAYAIEAALASHNPTVTGELHVTGLKLLRSPRYASRWSEVQRGIIHSEHVRFDLIRFDRVNRSIVPVYCVAGFIGSFVFRNIPWQSGGNGPEIEGRDF